MHEGRPTIRSLFEEVWRGAALSNDSSFKDRWNEFAAWPPDVFAFTWIVLSASGIYRLAVSPPKGHSWPPDTAWKTRVKETAEQWQTIGSLPSNVTNLGKLVEGSLDVAVESLSLKRYWSLCCALLELHITADTACAGVGIPSDKGVEPIALISSMFVTTEGTLSRVAPQIVRVLPKLRTPQSGISVGSLSHHLAGHCSEVTVSWNFAGNICRERDMRLNLLVLPWPLRLGSDAFKETSGPLRNMPSQFGFFEFAPNVATDVDRIGQLVEEAQRRVGSVHGLILPESAIGKGEIAAIEKCLEAKGVNMLVAGVRSKRRNYAHLGLFVEGRWRPFVQDKHHRWFLDRGQIYQYHLGSALHPKRKWWEDIQIRKRRLNFVTSSGWLTICHLICEDLARQEPVSQLVRAVGPNLVIALLLDGPQLKARWPARYATVLADDPGSSVLTVTSLGMALRSWSPEHPASRVVALWKDAKRGAVEITLERESEALLLTLTADFVCEWSADGRDDGTSASELVLSGIEQIG